MEMFECGAVGCSSEGNELTVVVEYETDLEGGAYEVGVAPEGSPGLGDVESIDCESGRTMYVVGEG